VAVGPLSVLRVVVRRVNLTTPSLVRGDRDRFASSNQQAGHKCHQVHGERHPHPDLSPTRRRDPGRSGLHRHRSRASRPEADLSYIPADRLRSSAANQRAQGWASRSAAKLSSGMAADCGLSRSLDAAAPSVSAYQLSANWSFPPLRSAGYLVRALDRGLWGPFSPTPIHNFRIMARAFWV